MLGIYDPGAREGLALLEGDPSRQVLADRMNATLDSLENDPTSSAVRPRRFTDPPVWCITVSGATEDWWILWREHEHPSGPDHPDNGIPHVIYIGPAA